MDIEKQKVELYKMFNAGTTKAELARMFNISSRTVGRWIESVMNAGGKFVAQIQPPVQEAVVEPFIEICEEYANKLAVYKSFHNDGVSKAELAREYDVSTRTIGRWIDLISNTTSGYVPGENIIDLEDEDEDEVVIEEVEVEYRVVASKKSVSITKVVGDQVEATYVMDSKNEQFANVLEIVVTSGFEQDALAKAYSLLQPKLMVESFTDGRIKVDVGQTTKIVYTPEIGPSFEVSGLLSKRIIEMVRTKGFEGAKSLINFLEKMMKNPSNRSVTELYGFLEHNDIEINAEGNFYAWKVVRSNYKDKHTGTFDNSIGTDVRVLRNQVDEDSDQTCSHGLHVCAKSYISHFSSSSDRVVKVEVNPEDVVAIPKDYNNAKMRCCGYKVVEDVTKQI